jgi:hypothetical protein
MNDPHVELLRYGLRTTDGLKFVNPEPLHHDEGRFICRLENRDLTVTMREHHANVPSARAVVQPFLDAWEVAEGLERGRRELWFEYANARMIDRAPPPPGGSHVVQPMAGDVVSAGGQATLTRGERVYPSPPSGFVLSSHVRLLWASYREYAEGRDKLAGMAFACYLHITEALAKGEADAARKFNVSKNVFETLSRLAGGGGRRKELTQEPYTPQEETWVATAVRVLIRRVGEHAAGATMKEMTLADLPKLS